MMAAPLAPLLWWQGKRVRRVTPVLPEAAGPRAGQWRCNGADTEVNALRVLLLGDSSAAGVGASHQDEALSGQLGVHLRAHLGRSLPRSVAWTLCARTGLRTREAQELLHGLPAQSFDVAVVALGVNDVTALQRSARWIADVDDLRIRLRDQLGVAQVLWSGLPPMHQFPALPQPLRAVMGRHARDLDAALARYARRLQGGVRHVPMPSMSRPEWIATDGFHPGPQAYAVWAGVLAQALVHTVAECPR